MDIFTLHILNSFHSQQQVVVFFCCRCWRSCEKCNGRGGGKNPAKNCCGAQNGLDPMRPCHNTLVKALKAWYIFNCWSSSESHSRKKGEKTRSSREFISERTKNKMMMKILRLRIIFVLFLVKRMERREKTTTNVDNKRVEEIVESSSTIRQCEASRGEDREWMNE